MHLSELIKHYEARCADHMQSYLRLELWPFTQNSHYLQESKDKWHAKYKDARAADTAPIGEPAAKRTKVGMGAKGKGPSTSANVNGAASPAKSSAFSGFGKGGGGFTFTPPAGAAKGASSLLRLVACACLCLLQDLRTLQPRPPLWPLDHPRPRLRRASPTLAPPRRRTRSRPRWPRSPRLGTRA